jgi:hypothetical protein
MPQFLAHDLGVEADKSLKRVGGELSEPPADRPVAGQSLKPAEPLHERVIGQECDVTQSATAGEPKGDEDQDKVCDAVVATQVVGPKGAPNAEIEANESKIPAEKLEARVAGQILLAELDAKIAVAPGMDFVVL